MKRRRFLAAATTGTAAGLTGYSQLPATSSDPETDGPVGSDATVSETVTTNGSLPESVALETLATGFEIPLDVAFAPDTDQLYVAEQGGRLSVLESSSVRDEPFLDLRDAVEVGAEMGLLGIALHPDFADNRRLFVRYSASPRPGTPSNYSHTFVLAEFEATADGRRAMRDSERTVLEIPEPQPYHNAGDLAFGPEGYLYVAVADGGGGGDRGRGHVADWYDVVNGGNGQDVTENLLGSILRLDVDGEPSSMARPGSGGTADGEGEGLPYAIPDDNPLVDDDGRDEQYAWGFRNPWRMSFDGEDFFVADVGQNRYEEVNLVEKSGNYGWNVREGTHCFEADDCPDETPEWVRGGEPLLDPIVEYPHSGGPISGNSVIGGYVYRGSALPTMAGAYVFADLDAGGQLFAARRPDDGGRWPTQVVDVAGDDGDRLRRVFSFGRDEAGEVYVLGGNADGGGLHRIVPSG